VAKGLEVMEMEMSEGKKKAKVATA